MKLSPTLEKLVLHWGEMGARWGISRSVAQVHALLYFGATAMPADEIAETLDIARSNVSTSLRELQTWGVVKVSHVMGDRREHFDAIHDVWRLFEILLDERKRREVDPTLHLLRELDESKPSPASLSQAQMARLQEMRAFFEQTDTWYAEVRKLPLPLRAKLVKYATKLRKWLE